jgi:hypothetical protein
VLSCRAAFETEPAVPLTAGGRAPMVAVTAKNSKTVQRGPVSCSTVLGSLLPLHVVLSAELPIRPR